MNGRHLIQESMIYLCLLPALSKHVFFKTIAFRCLARPRWYLAPYINPNLYHKHESSIRTKDEDTLDYASIFFRAPVFVSPPLATP